MNDPSAKSNGRRWKPSRLNRVLAALWCGALLRKGPMCCTTNCSCFNDVEDPDARRAKADEYVVRRSLSCRAIADRSCRPPYRARWQYRKEKLAHRQQQRAQADERRVARREAKTQRRASKRKHKVARRKAKHGDRQGSQAGAPVGATASLQPASPTARSPAVGEAEPVSDKTAGVSVAGTVE